MQQAESLEFFFHQEVDRALKDRGLKTGPLTEFYLVQLLSTYANHAIDDSPLGVKMMEALEANPPVRRERLREVGDTSLYVSGFWSDSFARRTVDVDYYIGLGGSAYGELARCGPGWARDPYGDVYESLAENFPRFVDVLTLVSQRMLPEPGAQDILKLYERWTKTRSMWAARRLARLGVVPPKPDDGERTH
jgi:hypothetical protein